METLDLALHRYLLKGKHFFPCKGLFLGAILPFQQITPIPSAVRFGVLRGCDFPPRGIIC